MEATQLEAAPVLVSGVAVDEPAWPDEEPPADEPV